VKRIFGIALLALALVPCPLGAQGQSNLSHEELQKWLDMTEQARNALQQGDLELANRLFSDLMLGTFRKMRSLDLSPKDRLTKLEQDAPAGGIDRFYTLADLAKAAFAAGDYNVAESYANELLKLAPEYRDDWNFGNAIFFGNMIIGRVALKRDNDVARAKAALMASGNAKSSPQLGSFGPNMSLADDLLKRGERESVIEFFTACKKIWTLHPEKLDSWIATVKGGGTPEWGASLNY
jgi:tetratricopeptide (TPR) repeat protein